VAFGIGFALKDMITNFLAGIMILLSKNFTIGDFIIVEGTMGRIIEIQSRVTIMQGADGTKVVVPNAQLFNKQVTSYTSNPFRRIDVETSVDYRSDLKNALKVCLIAAKRTKGVLSVPKPAILVSEFGDSAIGISVRVWVESRAGFKKIQSRLLINIKEAFDEYKIDYPFSMSQVIYDKDMTHGGDIDKKVEGKEYETEFSSLKVVEKEEAELNADPKAIAIDLDDGQALKPLAEQQYDQLK
jgi:small conductance mechanosensitive channel